MRNISGNPFQSWDFKRFVINALAEDIGPGDYSSMACVPAEAMGESILIFKETGIVAGMAAVEQILPLVDPRLTLKSSILDGASVEKGQRGAVISGPVQGILKAERLLLNLLQRLSGIATTTHNLVKMLEGYHTRLLDTRKTTPGMRIWEKWAVNVGGGLNHRTGLFDMIMLKDNHIDFAGGITSAIQRTLKFLKENNLDLAIEVETRNLDEVREVLSCGGIQRIMLDNFTPANIREALVLIGGKYETEASGGITERNILDYALTGVDYISMGALTHSVKSLDISLKFKN